MDDRRKNYAFSAAWISSCDAPRLRKSVSSNRTTQIGPSLVKALENLWMLRKDNSSRFQHCFLSFSPLNRRMLTWNSGIRSDLLNPLALGAYSPLAQSALLPPQSRNLSSTLHIHHVDASLTSWYIVQVLLMVIIFLAYHRLIREISPIYANLSCTLGRLQFFERHTPSFAGLHNSV